MAEKNEKQELEQMKNQEIKDLGQGKLPGVNGKYIELMTIIGEIEGHECSPQSTKTTKYEHMLPKLAMVEADEQIGGLLLLINTVGGDVESGLAIAEMIASLSKPTVSLVLGGSHSIGGPLAVAAKHSFIVPTGSMIIHPVRLNGTVIGSPQTYDYFKIIQERIIGFIAEHSNAEEERLLELMMNTGMMSKDLGTILVGEDAVKEGLIHEIGGMKEAIEYLRKEMKEKLK